MIQIKPILFSTPMVQAILRGDKTQTRRIIKVQPIDSRDWKLSRLIESTSKEDKKNEGMLHWVIMLNEYTINESDPRYFVCKYQTGDVLWVRETWALPVDNEGNDAGYMFKSDYDDNSNWWKWKPSIFMPKEAARIFLKVTKVRFERLNDISDKDAIAEGIPEDTREHLKWNRLYPDYLKQKLGVISACLNPKSSYQSLWDSINGKGSWAINPWVWVYEFEKIEKP